MIARGWLFVALVAALVFVACRDGASTPPPASIDAGKLTIVDVRERSLAALSRPDMVLHSTATVEVGAQDHRVEVWLDLARSLAREETYANGQVTEDDGLRIYYGGDRIATVNDGRLYDGTISAEYGSAPVPTAALALDYIATLFKDQDVKERTIEDARVGDAPAIVVNIVAPPGGDFDGEETTRIFLDEAFLPLKVETKNIVFHSELIFQNEFVPQASLAAGFFSPQVALASLVKTGADRMQEAIEEGFTPYWLGETYNELPLHDTNIIDSTDRGRGKALVVSYETIPPEGPDAPHYGMNFFEYSPGDWAKREEENATPNAALDEIPVAIAGGTAVIYRGFGQLHLVAIFEDAVVEVTPNIGADNPYRNVEALTAVAQALSRFEP